MTLTIIKSSPKPFKPDVMQAINQHQECSQKIEDGYQREKVHEYADKDGNTLFYRVRLKHPVTKEKWIRPVYFSENEWVWKEPKFPEGLKPLYNLQAIAANPEAKIWICEGEWAVDHLNEFFKAQNIHGENIATTSGSGSSAEKADWSPLTNHNIVIWHDNDESGVKYCNAVVNNLGEFSCDIEIVDVKSLKLPKKGDVVDWLDDNPDVGLAEFESISLVCPPPEYEPLFDIADASVVNFLNKPPPKRNYLLSQCLPLGKVGLLVGMGGVRKSQFMLQTQIAVATGKALCGKWSIEVQGATLGLYAEEDREELHRRLYYIAEGLSKANITLVEERVHMRSMTGAGCQMVIKESSSGVAITDLVYRLIETTKQIPNLKLIIIDPLSRFYGGDENVGADATRFIEACEILAQETGATVLIVHHVNKASISAQDSSQAAVRGSSAFTDGVRWQMNMNVMSSAEAKKFGVPDNHRKSYVKAVVTKNNYAPPQSEDVWLELTAPNGILHAAELFTASDCKAEDSISKIIKQIEKDAANGKEFSKSAFAKEYGGSSNIFKIGDKGLRGLIEQAIEKGNLICKSPKTPTKNVTEVLAVPIHDEPELHASLDDIMGKL